MSRVLSILLFLSIVTAGAFAPVAAFAEPVEGEEPPAAAVPAPAGLTVERIRVPQPGEPEEVRVSWTSPSEGADTVTHEVSAVPISEPLPRYGVKVPVWSATSVAPAATSAVLIISPGTDYRVEVVARDDTTASEPAVAVHRWVSVAPGPVQLKRVVRSFERGTITLRWTAGSEGTDRRRAWEILANGDVIKVLRRAKAKSIYFRLPRGKNYEFQVRAVSAAGRGQAGNSRTVAWPKPSSRWSPGRVSVSSRGLDGYVRWSGPPPKFASKVRRYVVKVAGGYAVAPRRARGASYRFPRYGKFRVQVFAITATGYAISSAKVRLSPPG